MKSMLLRLGLVALIIGPLAGCGGGSDGAAGSAGATGPAGATGATGPAGKDASATVNVANLTADQWKALKPSIDPSTISVSISSPPVVKFKVTDDKGNPVVGLGGQSKSSTAVAPTNYNVAFTLAKLVPGTNGSPSKWATYLVTTPKAAGTAGTVVNGGVSWAGNFPQQEREGTFVDNGDGSYQYTFYRDIKQAATIVAGLTDSADGLSKIADLGDVSYDPTLTHRLGIIISGSQPGTGTATPTGVTSVTAVPMVNTFNIGYDFVPAGGAVTATRDIVVKASCTACHAGKGIGHVNTTASPGDSIGRNDPRLCVTCHTDQIKYSFDQGNALFNADGVTFTVQTGSNAVVRPAQAIIDGRAVGNFPNLVHKMHMGEKLVKKGYNFNNDGAGMFNEKRYPQDIKNCTKCHDGSASAVNKTANGDNWKMVPSRLACGSCHDGINFATGLGYTLADARKGSTTPSNHAAGQGITSDAACAQCHASTFLDVAVSHQQTGYVSAVQTTIGFSGGATNPKEPYSINGALPAGAYKLEYVITSVAVNAAGNPSVKFQVKKDGTVVNFGTYDATSNPEPIANVIGGPSIYFAYNLPQDGIASPSDYNKYSSVALGNSYATSSTATLALGRITKGLWASGGTLTASGITWTLSGPDSSGNYTVSNDMQLPATANMLTAVVMGNGRQANAPGYPYSMASADFTLQAIQPSTTTTQYVMNKPGLILTPLAQKKELTGSGGNGVTFVARRSIVDEASCNSCHQQLGTSPMFHGGSFNITICAMCHNANQANSSGWTADARNHIHGIHAASKRTQPFTWHTKDYGDSNHFANLEYPGVLKNCTQCHKAGTYDFSASVYTDTLKASLLWPSVATGTPTTAAADPANPYVAQPIAPYLPGPSGTNYGANYAVTWNAGALTVTPAAATTLVTSPLSVACFACHDSASAMSHMRTNGASIYAARSVAMPTGVALPTEACLTCHGPNAEFAIAKVHK